MQYRLTESQRRFWKGHQLQPDVPLYNMAWRFDLHFNVQPDLFQRAFLQTLDENEILRTVFWGGADSVVQTVADLAEGLLEIRDFSLSKNPEETLNQELNEWVQIPFDLAQNTLRSQLVKLGDSHWVWAVCQHHIVCDAQSGALFFDQVSQRYLDLKGKHPGKVDPLPSYFDILPSEVPSNQSTGASGPRAATPPYGSKAMRTSFSQRLTIGMEQAAFDAMESAIARPEFRLFTPDLSRLAIYLTAYFAYLFRVTGDDEITIGLPSHNRLSERDRNTIGPFVEVLPLSLQIDACDTLLDLHAKTKSGLGAFLRHAKPGAVASMDTSEISAVCNFIQARFGDFAGHPATVQWLHSGAHDAAHAMRLHIMNFSGQGAPELFLDVHNEILEAVTEQILCSHFTRVLRAVTDAPETRVTAVALSSHEHDQAILIGQVPDPGIPPTVLEAFAAQVAKSPDSPALSIAETQMTYRQVNERSDDVAKYLDGLGIARGSNIAIHMPRSPEIVWIILGILKVGCSFVPIAASTPQNRVQQIVEISDAAAIFLAPDDNRNFGCRGLSAGSIPASKLFAKTGVGGAELAYVLFTSGSTGTPKGVAVSHANLSRYIHWAADTFSGNRPAHYAFFSSISFDLTLTSLFAPLVTGGSIRVYPERSDPDLAVLDVFAEDKVDIVKLTPSHLALACKQGQPIERIQTLVLGGENLTSQLCRKAQGALSSSLKIVNEYGPTEAVVGAMHHVYNVEKDTRASVQIGTPAAGVSVSVRDEGMNVCPVGVIGEIVIGGRLAEGYVGDPSLSADKFLDDPAGLQGRVYRTGDIGRINQDQSFEYLGRADQQIKIGGVRFEVAEIERALRQITAVHSVHVTYGSSVPSGVTLTHCKRCGLSDAVPGVQFLERDLCETCFEFDTYKERAAAYFPDTPELERKIARAASSSNGKFDAIMMLSGGKDSTYAAYRLADYSSRVLAVTLDNGYISDQAKENIQRVTNDLGWEHRYLSTDKMNQIFVDSLKTHSNVCQGCFKALYTLVFRTALAEGAPMVVTGLSRGQFFETRLTPELFRNSAPTCAQLDDMVARARKAYHAEDDEISRLLKTDDLKDGRFLSQIEVLDIYRYIDVPVSEIYDFLEKNTPWRRPTDTGRSSNCLINDAGIYVHKTREGYHNYALPYAWDVRMGHKTREQALEELNDDIDTKRVTQILDEIGFDEPVQRRPSLCVYVAGEDLSEQVVWDVLYASLPREVVPDQVVILEDMPLNSSGKVDTARLPKGHRKPRRAVQYVAPKTETEIRLTEILSRVLDLPRISVAADFFDLGVDSLAAIEMAMKTNEEGFAIPATALFEQRTVKDLAEYVDSLPSSSCIESEDAPLIDLDDDDLSNITEALR